MALSDDIISGKYSNKSNGSALNEVTKKKKKKLYSDEITSSDIINNNYDTDWEAELNKLELEAIEKDKAYKASGAGLGGGGFRGATSDDRGVLEKTWDTILGVGGNLLMGAESAISNTVDYLDTTARHLTGEALEFGAKTLLKNTSLDKDQVNKVIDNISPILGGKIYETASRTVDNPFYQGNQLLNNEEMEQWRNETIQANIDKSAGKVGKYVAELAPSIGQNLTNMGITLLNPTLGTVTFMTSAGGSYLDEGRARGMKDDELVTYATVMGGIEGLTERLISGQMIGAGAKLVGAKQITKETIASVSKTFGFTIGENFVQEAAIVPLNELTAQTVAGKEHADWEHIFERSMKAGFDGAVSAVILGGVSAGVGSSVRVYNKMQNGQQVTQEEITQAVNDAREAGIPVDQIAEQNIQEAVNIGIEQATQQAPVDNTAQIQGLQESIATKQEELNKAQDPREQQIIQEEINNLNQELTEATNAQQFTNAPEKQHFTYKASENDSEVKKAVYESASKYFNDTKASHDFVDTVAKIAEDRGTKYEFASVEEIKEAIKKEPNGENVDLSNVSVNGFVTSDGRVLINVDSKQGLDFIVGHETTHLLEGTAEYKALHDIVVEYAKEKGIYEDRVAKLHSLYKDKNANIENELTSDLVGELLFTDQAFIENLSVKQPTLFEKIKNFISDLIVKVKGTEQEKQLRKIQRSFEKAYRAKGTQTSTQANTKYSLSEKKIQGLEDYSTEEIKSLTNSFIQEKLEENDIYDVTIKDIDIHGSRGRGTARVDSDLDVVVEYEGDIREDDLFNILNEEPMFIDGIQVDINPITEPLNDYMERSNAYDQEILSKNKPKYSLSDNQGRELSKEQQEFFKDSKARDENGNMLTLYHGTNSDFNIFKKGKRGYLGPGIYLSDRQSNAERYTDYGIVKEVYANITNPLTVTSDLPDKQILRAIYGNDTVYNRRSAKQGLATFIVTSNDLKKLQEMGYDGIIWEHPSGNEYMVFDSNQLKNTDNTNPTANPDIRYSLSENTEIPLEQRLSGDDLLNAEDLIYEIEDIAEVSPNGYVTLYHRTSQENANKIYETGKMSAKEDGVFFSTKNAESQAVGFGEAVVKVKVPVEKLVLDDIFSDEAHLKIPLKTKNEVLDVSQYLIKDNYSLSAKDDTAPIGNVFGEDLKVQVEEAIAPLQENIAALTEQVQAITNQFENIAPTSQEVVEQQAQENMANINDNDAPRSFEDIAEEAMWNEDFETGETTGNKVESPFDSRDIDEVGNRKVKAYQYENPEVRPFFRAEAENMLWDLDNTIKGERSFNDQLYYDSNGEQGFYGTTRQTTEAIAYLKDKYGYSYDQIRKGLNDIIEDNGLENNAVAKRIEFMLDERLREGYTTSDGIPIPANEEYIKFLEERQIIEYNREISSALTDADVPGIEEAQQEPAPEPRQSVSGQFELRLDKDIAPEGKVAQNQNTELSDTSTETQEQEKIAKILSEAPTPQNRQQRLWAKSRAAFLDKGSVFEDLSIKKKNRNLMAKWDYILTAESRAQNVMMNGTYEYDATNKERKQVSKSLNDIRTEVGDRVQEFSEYLYHKHNISRMSIESNAQARMAELQETTLKGKDIEEIARLSRKRTPAKIDKKTNSEQLALELQIQENLINDAKEYMRLSEAKNKPVFGESVTAEVSQKRAEEFENNNPEFMDWAKDVYDYNNANLAQLVKNGVISQETADQFAEIYPYYVPIGRNKTQGNAINVPLDTNRTGINTPIKRATGGDTDILPLFDTMAKRTIQTYKATAKNSFGVELKNSLNSVIDNQATTTDEILDNVDQQEDLLQEGKNGQAPTFTVFENGEKVTYEITKDMYDALKPVSESSILNTTFKPSNKMSNFHRGVLTEYNITFMLTNGIKDVQDILLNSQHPAKTYAKMPESYAQILNKGYWYQEYMANGGEQNSYFDSQDGTFDTEKKGVSKILDLPPLKQISKLNNFVELAPRLAEYIASRESGRNVEISMLDAARVTTNFKAGGDVTKWANRNGATFLNASIQGAMQQVRNVREAHANGVKGYANLAAKFALAGLPAMILNGLLWGDDEEYEELSDYVKQNYYIVGKYGDGNFIRIPKGRMITVVQEGLNQMANLVTGNGEADLGQFLEIVGNNIAPNNPVESNVLSPIIQAATNTTWYGDDLVPTRLQDEPVKEQYDESTDKLSIFLGQALGISPYKINYVIDQYSGGIGDVFLPMMTQEAETGTDSIGEQLIAPLTNKFTVDSVMKNQNVSDLYTASEELTSKANSTSATDNDILQNKYLNSVKSEMNELYKQKREIQSSNLSDSEKYNQVRDIQKQINSMAEEALESYQNVNKTSNYASIGNKEYYLKKDTWTKVESDELEDLNSLNMTLKDKSTYFTLKGEISEIKASDIENKKKEIATAVKDTNLTDEQKAYIYGKNYSSDETLDLVLNSGISFNSYLDYASQEFVADKDSDGKSISGSRRKKVISYINSLELNIPQKAMLIRTEYSTFDNYNKEIVRYVSGLELDYADKVKMLESLDLKVSSNGTVSW